MCDVDLQVTLPIIGAVLHDTRLSEIEADLTLLTTTGGDLTRLTMTATAGGLTHDLAPLSAGHRLGDMIGPTLVMTPGTIHQKTATTGDAAINLSLGAFHQG